MTLTIKINEKLNPSVEWLLQGDVSIRFQTKRDLLKHSKKDLLVKQRKTNSKGWCANLLSLQDEHGPWNQGFYTPKWTSTTYTLALLRRLNLDPENEQARKACALLAENGINEGGGIGYGWKNYPRGEICITGITLAFFSYFGIPDKNALAKLIDYLIVEQMPDGGWNCKNFRGATHSSFHTTMSVLEGLWEFEKRHKKDSRITEARLKAHEFLFRHQLYKSHRTGKVVDEKYTRFSFPPRWRYDIFKALDYFQDCNSPYDERMNDALHILIKKEKDGKWNLQQKHAGIVFFDLEPIGKPSRINTLRAFRILNKYGKYIE